MIPNRPSKSPVLAFGLPFEGKLNPQNRWCILATLLPWDAMAAIYNNNLCADNGRPALNARLVLGALFAKHLLQTSDEETILHIQENVYLQYFVGLEVFQQAPIFDPSLFVSIRKRLGEEGINALEEAIVSAMLAARCPKQADANAQKEDENPPTTAQAHESTTPQNDSGQADTVTTTSPFWDKEPTAKLLIKDLPHKGQLIIDVTVAPQKIKYPTDLDLLNNARQKIEYYIDLLCAQLQIPRATYRTYRYVAYKAYLKVAKKRKKSTKVLRAGLRKQLGYLRRNLLIISKLIERINTEQPGSPLKGWLKKDIEEYATIQTLYQQQQDMYDTRSKRCDNRIVSICQPYVRPIKRGKDKVDTEFGAKIAIATKDGISTIDNYSWNAYHESTDLKIHIERYYKLYQCYPESINCDKIYHTRDQLLVSL